MKANMKPALVAEMAHVMEESTVKLQRVVHCQCVYSDKFDSRAKGHGMAGCMIFYEPHPKPHPCLGMGEA